MSNLRPIRCDNLRAAPESLTPAVADQLVALAQILCRPSELPQRQLTGAYPFLDHRSAADLAASEASDGR